MKSIRVFNILFFIKVLFLLLSTKVLASGVNPTIWVIPLPDEDLGEYDAINVIPTQSEEPIAFVADPRSIGLDEMMKNNKLILWGELGGKALILGLTDEDVEHLEFALRMENFMDAFKHTVSFVTEKRAKDLQQRLERLQARITSTPIEQSEAAEFDYDGILKLLKIFLGNTSLNQPNPQ